MYLRRDPEEGDSRTHSTAQQWLLGDALGRFLMVTNWLPRLQTSHPHLPICKAEREEKAFSLHLVPCPPFLKTSSGYTFQKYLSKFPLDGDWVTDHSIERLRKQVTPMSAPITGGSLCWNGGPLSRQTAVPPTTAS